MAKRKRLFVWSRLDDPDTVFPCDKWPERPTVEHPECCKTDCGFPAYVKCELVPVATKRKKKGGA